MDLLGHDNGQAGRGINSSDTDENHVTTLVDFVLKRAMESISQEEDDICTSPHEYTKKKSKMSKSKKVYCVERTIDGLGEWEIVQYSPEEFNKEFESHGEEKTVLNSSTVTLKETGTIDDKPTQNLLNPIEVDLTRQPLKSSMKKKEIDNQQYCQIGSYVQDIIFKALQTIIKERNLSSEKSVVEYGMLFHTPSVDDFHPGNNPKLVIDTIPIDTSKDSTNGEEFTDDMADEVVTIVLQSAVESSQSDVTDRIGDLQTSERPVERRRSSVTLEIIPPLSEDTEESSKRSSIFQRLPKLISVKRFIGFRRRPYTQTKVDDESSCIQEDLPNCTRAEETTCKQESSEKNNQPIEVADEAMEGAASPRKTTPFSRRIFSRLFGGGRKQGSLSVPNLDRENDDPSTEV